MVTGGDEINFFGLIGLAGCNFSESFFYFVAFILNGKVAFNEFTCYTIEKTGSMQVESDAFGSLGEGFFTSETNPFGDRASYRLSYITTGSDIR